MAGPPISNLDANNNDLVQEPRIQGTLLRIYSSGKDQFFRLGFGGPSQLRTHALVGTVSEQASLFAEAPVTSICGFSMGPVLYLIPLSTKIDGVKHAIQPDRTRSYSVSALHLRANNHCGLSRLVRSKTSSQVNDTAWFGRQTTTPVKSLNPSPGQCGMICYANGLAFCGFAWVER